MARWILVLVATGCVESSTVVCADGRVCPAGTVCNDVNAACVDPSQLTSCESQSDGATCEIDDEPIGVCVNGACLGHSCGDGRRSGSEMCDPSAGDASTCSALGYYQGDEVTCEASCVWDRSSCAEFCGDGVLNGNELCEGTVPPPATTCLDFGFDRGRLGCGGCAPSFTSCASIGWQQRPLGAATATVFGASASGGAVYALGGTSTNQSVVLRLSSAGWIPVGTFPAGTPIAVSAVADDDVWAVGGSNAPMAPYGAIFHYDGAAWTTVRIPDGLVTAVWASGSHVYALEGTTVHHFDGTTWSEQDLGGPVEAISGTSLDDIWIAGGAGVFHSSGGAFALVAAAPATARAVHAFAPGKVALLEARGFNQGLRAHVFDGVSWTNATFMGGTLGNAAIVAHGANDLFVHASFGLAELVLHHDGSRWRQLGSPASRIDAVAGSSTELLVFDSTSSYRFNGSAWRPEEQPPTQILAMWGTAPDDLYASSGTQGVLYHFDGNDWSAAGSARGAADGIDANVVYSLADTTLWEKAGSWTNVAALPATARAPIAVRGADDVFVGVGGNTVHHWNGAAFTPTNVDVTSVRAMDCSPQGECYLVSRNGVVLRTTGSAMAWAPVAVPTDVDLSAVWVAGPSRVFIGGQGVLAWYDGASWHEAETQGTVHAIHGTSPTDVFAITDAALLHFDGIGWQPVRPALHFNTRQVTVLATGPDVYIAGSSVAGFELDRLVRIDAWQ